MTTEKSFSAPSSEKSKRDNPSARSSNHSLGISLNDDKLKDATGGELSAKIQAYTPEDPLIGSIIGNFRIVKKIGKGGFGAVYKAEQIYLEEPFAIKVLHLTQNSQPEVIKRFQREARALVQLKHDKIVHLSDFGMIPEHGFYLVMEFLEGRSLHQALKRKEVFTIARIQSLMTQLCEVLDFVHRKGIVHRDLKPGNIFLLEDEEGLEKVKLIDFGIAALMDAQGAEAITKTGTYLGTAKFASPEQAKGSGDLDGRSDLYSLAIILFRLLTGRVPFTHKNVMRIIYDQINSTPPSLSELIPHKRWSPLLEDFFRMAFAKDREKRPATARLFGELCRKALDDQNRIDREVAQQNKKTIPMEPPLLLAQTAPNVAPLATGELVLEPSEAVDTSDSDESPSTDALFEEDSSDLSPEIQPKPSHQPHNKTLAYSDVPLQKLPQKHDTIPENPTEKNVVTPTIQEETPPAFRRPAWLILFLFIGALILLGGVFFLSKSPQLKGTQTAIKKNATNSIEASSPISAAKNLPHGTSSEKKASRRRSAPAQPPRSSSSKGKQKSTQHRKRFPSKKVKRPSLRRYHKSRRHRSRRMMQEHKKRTSSSPRKTFLNKAAMAVGPCGKDGRGWSWIYLESPRGVTTKVKLFNCPQCWKKRVGKNWCIALKGRLKAKVRVSAEGFYPCSHEISLKHRRIRWKLKEDDPLKLAPSPHYHCAYPIR